MGRTAMVKRRRIFSFHPKRQHATVQEHMRESYLYEHKSWRSVFKIRKLANNKAAGDDEIASDVWKDRTRCATSVFTGTLNTTFREPYLKDKAVSYHIS